MNTDHTWLLRAGLCNRLRFLLAVRSARGRVKVYWPVDQHTPGLFLDVFEPLHGLEFVPREINCGAVMDYRLTFKAAIEMNGHPWSMALERAAWRSLVPRKDVVARLPVDIPWPKTLGLHIRRTDNAPVAAATPDTVFHRMVKRHRGPVWLATDCAATRQRFRATWGNRIMGLDFTPVPGLRQSTLPEAVADLVALSRCGAFFGCQGSSFSRAAQMMAERGAR